MSKLLPIGTELQAQRYRVEQQLSSGGFGNTYAIINTRFGERWALKEFFMKGISERESDATTVSVASASQSQFEAQREKFNKEAKRLRKLHHPGIVHVEDLFDENGTSYYVMDYIGGGSLSEAVKRALNEETAHGIKGISPSRLKAYVEQFYVVADAEKSGRPDAEDCLAGEPA